MSCANSSPRPIDRDHLAVAQDRGGGARRHDGRQVELTTDDRGVTGHPAPVGDEGGGPSHGGHPVGVGHRRHQHLARHEAGAVCGAAEDADRPGGHAGGGSQSADEDRAQHLPFSACATARPSFRGCPPRVVIGRDCTIHVCSLQGELDVLGGSVVPLDLHRHPCQRQQPVVVEHPSGLLIEGTATLWSCPSGPRTIFSAFAPRWTCVMRGPSLDTTYVSGSTCPPTTTSPRPKAASMTRLPRSPVAGSAVNMTPDAVESTMPWTTTAMLIAGQSRCVAR